VPGIGGRQQRRGNQLLDEAIAIVAAAAPPTAPVQVRTEICYSATVPALIDMSRDADLIVVGRRGQTALDPLLGAVTSGLIQHAHCPVAVIHDEAGSAQLTPRAPVLVGVDGSEVSELATAIAFDEASLRQADLIVLYAWSGAALLDLPGVEWSALKTAGEGVLADWLAGLRPRYPNVTVHCNVVCDQPARQLIECSDTAQLVVVGSHGRGGFAGMTLGSVSAAVVQGARVPVLVARPRCLLSRDDSPQFRNLAG
jgi:nucleotide-binding universal stress UspA family protein